MNVEEERTRDALAWLAKSRQDLASVEGCLDYDSLPASC
jgi:hypothetical protein